MRRSIDFAPPLCLATHCDNVLIQLWINCMSKCSESSRHYSHGISFALKCAQYSTTSKSGTNVSLKCFECMLCIFVSDEIGGVKYCSRWLHISCTCIVVRFCVGQIPSRRTVCTKTAQIRNCTYIIGENKGYAHRS